MKYQVLVIYFIW